MPQYGHLRLRPVTMAIVISASTASTLHWTEADTGSYWDSARGATHMLTVVCGRRQRFGGGVIKGLHRACHALGAGVERADRRAGRFRYNIQGICSHCTQVEQRKNIGVSCAVVAETHSAGYTLHNHRSSLLNFHSTLHNHDYLLHNS